MQLKILKTGFEFFDLLRVMGTAFIYQFALNELEGSGEVTIYNIPGFYLIDKIKEIPNADWQNILPKAKGFLLKGNKNSLEESFEVIIQNIGRLADIPDPFSDDEKRLLGEKTLEGILDICAIQGHRNLTKCQKYKFGDPLKVDKLNWAFCNIGARVMLKRFSLGKGKQVIIIFEPRKLVFNNFYEINSLLDDSIKLKRYPTALIASVYVALIVAKTLYEHKEALENVTLNSIFYSILTGKKAGGGGKIDFKLLNNLIQSKPDLLEHWKKIMEHCFSILKSPKKGKQNVFETVDSLAHFIASPSIENWKKHCVFLLRYILSAEEDKKIRKKKTEKSDKEFLRYSKPLIKEVWRNVEQI